ncbi:hypothetical protein [Maribacter sp.]|uniref:leucine-rich repeat domain-containing protein n=1 Tax=Maribacter sp. TaxID=1897614 RepID=UPI0025BC4F7F|nr:hypothetical protein [Maribacter sp.]
MKQILLPIKIVLLLFFTSLSTAQVSEKEKIALLDLYNSTNGKEWTSAWDLSKPIDSWYGLSVKDNHVVSINLHRNNLQGNIPKSIENLIYLKELNFAFNKLTGELPAEITSFSQLVVLKLEMNQFKGELPKDYSKLGSLKELTLFNNSLEGTIPAGIGAMSSLTLLNLSSNYLTGNLPKSIEEMTSLESLELFGNKFEGQINIDLSELQNLRELVLSYNNFDGVVPESIQELSSLKFVQLQGNKFSSFKGLENLQSEGLLTFDSDNVDLNRKYNKPKFRLSRLADSKFEDSRARH